MDQTSGHATNARRNLLWMIFTLTVITFLDRLAIAAAMPGMTRDFGFTAAEKGYIFSAFSIAYAAFEIPSGWLGDRFGARLALTRIVLWWSAFTSLTGAALGFRSMVLIRFLFGAGEAGAFPNVARAISRWFGVAEQGRAMSVSFLGLAAGSALAAPLIFSLLEWQHWRWVFVELGVLGAIWALVWHRWFRDEPGEHPGVNAVELGRIRAGQLDADLTEPHRVDWRAVLTSPNMIRINLMYFAYGYGIFFYMTWLPTYLIEGRGFSIGSTKWLASLPWVISLPSYLLGGWLTDRLARRPGGLRLARGGVGITGYLLSAGLLILVARVENHELAAALLALALCAQTLTACAAWAVCLDVGRRNAGVVTGLMNTIGNVGGALAPVVVGIAVGRFQSWNLPFYIMAGLFTLGAIVWAFIDPEQSVLEHQQ
jgi:ACS family glucarate transporter-like MFS transporter